MKPKVILGLSGGVDSAAAATMLLEDYDVIALYLSIGPEADGESDAREVAAALGIPFYVKDISAALETHVKAPFAGDYLAGRTPLPCARCNPLVKFPALLALAEELGAEYVATGHYARITRQNGRAVLCKGMAPNDQSYMLARLPQNILQRVLFPLGEYNKAAVRAYAQARGLPVAEKPDSMELCFIPDNDYGAWLEKRGPTPTAGDFLSPEGQVLGRHQGIHRYTLGQGRGLGVSGPHRYFVSRIDPAANTVTLSDGSDLYRSTVFCVRPNWITVEALTEPVQATVRLRHSRGETSAAVIPTPEGVTLRMDQPARAPTPGQLAVFYQGDRVLGSAWIERSEET